MRHYKNTITLRSALAMGLVAALHGAVIEYLLNSHRNSHRVQETSTEAHIVAEPIQRLPTIEPLPLDLADPQTEINEPTLVIDTPPAKHLPPALQIPEQLRPHIEDPIISTTGVRAIPDEPNIIPADIYLSAVGSDARDSSITLSLLILANGTVYDAQIDQSSGSQALDSATTRYAKKHWRFQPGTRNGVPIANWKTVIVVFSREEISLRY